MKRLGSKLAHRVLAAFKVARLLRRAEWMDVSVSDPNLVQYITDAMASGGEVQINYEGSGWRDILPYGWNTSKEGNILLMCYKDTGEIRSYRLDRVLDVRIDSDSQAGQDMTQTEETGGDMMNFNLPDSALVNEERPEDSPFAEQMQTLENDQPTQTEQPAEEQTNKEQPVEEEPQEMAG